MKHFYPFLLITLMLSLSIISCQKETFVLPEDESLLAGDISEQYRAPDSLRLNFLWIKPHGENTPPGARFQLLNDTGGVVINSLDMMSGNDSVFVYSPYRGLEAKAYLVQLKSPTGAIIDSMTLDFSSQNFDDEWIIENENVTYYMQLSWLYKQPAIAD